MYWTKVDGLLGITLSFIQRLLVKIIIDFSGCLHFRSSYEMGGASFCVSMLWAQVMPFVALQLFETDVEEGEFLTRRKDQVTVFLVLSLFASSLMFFAFFCTIDISYLDSFVSR